MERTPALAQQAMWKPMAATTKLILSIPCFNSSSACTSQPMKATSPRNAPFLPAQRGVVPTIPGRGHLLRHGRKVPTCSADGQHLPSLHQSPASQSHVKVQASASHYPATTYAADVVPVTHDRIGASLESATAEGSEPARDQEASFSWSRAWYAVNVVEQLDVSRPHGFHLLGRPLVLWRDKEGQWRCFLDQCPHRLVPLSEGRIDEQGNLQCSYHGWSFAACGACARIPQLPDNSPAVTSRRACATSFPVRVVSGIIFVWPDEHNSEAAALTPVPVPSVLATEEERLGHSSTQGGSSSSSSSGNSPSPGFFSVMRDVPYSYETLAENLMDPAHLPFSHHGVGTLKRDQGGPFREASVADENVHGFRGTIFEPSKVAARTVQFMAPSLFYYQRPVTPKTKQKAVNGSDPTAAPSFFYDILFLTPTLPGRSRIIVMNGPLSSGRFSLLPRWFYHIALHDILDGDAYFLHGQDLALQALQLSSLSPSPPTPTAVGGASFGDDGAERTAATVGLAPPTPDTSGVPAAPASAADEVDAGQAFQLPPVRWAAAYYMPASADRLIVAFRQWLDRYAGSGVQWPSSVATQQRLITQLPKEDALNRYKSHTKDCAMCSDVYVKLGHFHKATLAASVLAAVVAFTARSWRLRIIWAAVGVVCAALGVKSADFRRKFSYVGWDHASRK